MSSQELDRLQVIQRGIEGRMTQRAAATSLGIGYRTMKRLVANYRQRGAAGLVSGKRGRPSNHRLPSSYIDQIIAIVREHYADFGPTLAAEKLQDRLYLARRGQDTKRKFMHAKPRRLGSASQAFLLKGLQNRESRMELR